MGREHSWILVLVAGPGINTPLDTEGLYLTVEWGGRGKFEILKKEFTLFL